MELSKETQQEIWAEVAKLSDNNLSMMYMSAIKAASSGFEFTQTNKSTEWLLEEKDKILQNYNNWLGLVRKQPERGNPFNKSYGYV